MLSTYLRLAPPLCTSTAPLWSVGCLPQPAERVASPVSPPVPAPPLPAPPEPSPSAPPPPVTTPPAPSRPPLAPWPPVLAPPAALVPPLPAPPAPGGVPPEATGAVPPDAAGVPPELSCPPLAELPPALRPSSMGGSSSVPPQPIASAHTTLIPSDCSRSRLVVLANGRQKTKERTQEAMTNRVPRRSTPFKDWCICIKASAAPTQGTNPRDPGLGTRG